MVFLLFGVFFVTIFLGFPVAFSMAASSIVYLLAADIPLSIIAQKMYVGMDSFTLLCVPGFILAGNLMNFGGITNRIIRFCNSFLGHIRGGLAQVNVFASMVFAGISGTALADTSSLGAILIPAMKKEGYDADFSVAVTAASSTVGPIIPPSMPMILVGTLTGLSVSKLFVAGVIPGILIGLGQMTLCYLISKKRDYPRGPKQPLREVWNSFKDAVWALLLTVLILFGILGGFFSPTEASCMAAVYAFVVGMFVYKELKWKDIPHILYESAVMIAGIMLLVGFANLFAWILSSEQIPQMIANAMLSISRNKYVLMILINILLLFVGMFMETNAALLILFPILLNVATQVGVHPIQFAVVMVLNLITGLCTPPVGVCLFVASSIGGISLSDGTKAILPFVAWNIVVLLLISYIPFLTTWLPGLIQ